MILSIILSSHYLDGLHLIFSPSIQLVPRVLLYDHKELRLGTSNCMLSHRIFSICKFLYKLDLDKICFSLNLNKFGENIA